MTGLNPSMRLKVKGDTFFLPDPDGHVYFRNNSGSFKLEGSTIDQWIEKLIPVFNGKYTLDDLTNGLPEPYRDRVYEIAGKMYENGFVRDVSQDRPHQLPDEVLQNFAPQIELLDNFGDSGAYRFQSYREAPILAVGSGSFLASLVAALFESGMPKVHVLITKSEPAHRWRLAELEAHARRADPEAALVEVGLQEGWREAVQPFHSILYVSEEGNTEELRALHAVCRAEKKVFLPAMCMQQVGFAGPVVHPDSEGCWESAWRRIHRSAIDKDPQLHPFSSVAGAMLANVIVFELFKTVTGMTEAELYNQFFLLDLETLEGGWHTFVPHPLVTGRAAVQWVQDLDVRLEHSKDGDESGGLLPFFNQLTSPQSGIFHSWEEGDLKQLPLALCRVRPADPLSEGPVMPLPDIIAAGLTHEEARREAGLAGIEAYLSRMVRPLAEGKLVQPHEFVGVGAGATVAEGVSRGLRHRLDEELRKRQEERQTTVIPLRLRAVEDDRCRYYLQALTTLQGEPMIGLGEELCGFPVAWIGTGGRWYGSAGLNATLALRQALQQALLKVQHPAARLTQAVEVLSLQPERNARQSLVISPCEDGEQSKVLQSALQVLKRNQKRLEVFELTAEPLWEEELAGAFGVVWREEEHQ